MFFTTDFSSLFGQIIFKNLPQKEVEIRDSLFQDTGEIRKIKFLHGSWKVYKSDSKKIEKVNVEIPSVFEGEGNLIFEKSFTLTPSEVSNYKLKLHFFGVNYSADISLNNISIYRHPGGEYPFSLDLPKDILHSDKPNVLLVKLSARSDSRATIPVKQKFLFPQYYSGIFRDVYIHFTPNIFISDLSPNIRFDQKLKKFLLTIQAKIENRELRATADTSIGYDHFTLFTQLLKSNGEIVSKPAETKFILGKNKETYLSQVLEIPSFNYWTPDNPSSYIIKSEILQNEKLIDRTSQEKALLNLSFQNNLLTLNNQNFTIRGVAYYPSFEDYGGLISYSQMEKDIKLIKKTGFNAVRFAKKIPHPYLLVLCQRFGLMPFIELPINAVPSSILDEKEFNDRVKNYVYYFLKGFKNYFVSAIGVGSSYSNSDAEVQFIQNLCGLIKKDSKALTYASLLTPSKRKIENLDLYGIEIFDRSSDFKHLIDLIKNDTHTEANIFISEATCIVNRGNSDGYLNKNSFEAQAKFFDETIDLADKQSLPAYFLNAMFDYRGDYPSVIAGYSEENLLHLGLANEDRDTDRISYKVVFAKLNNSERVTIPIGSKKDDSPMLFIITGILIALMMGIMINSGKKFREDSSRALLRPYNFFADVRDQRLISIFHTLIVLIIIAATSGLLLSNILFYLKESIRFEKLLLSFGYPNLLQKISYLAWNPLASIWWLTILTLIFFAALIILIQTASLFVRTRVSVNSVFHTVTWSFLPLVLLIPIGIILYKMLSADAFNLYLFLGMIFFTVWIFYRLMKGIYVIFDVNPASVYVYSLIVIVIIAASLLIYFQLSNSTFTYLLQALNEFKF